MKHSAKLFLLTILMVSFKYSYSQTYIPQGAVSGIWTSSNSPYIVQGDITVPAEETLIIEAGAEILFDGYYGMHVNGTLMSIGTQSSPISFFPIDTTNMSNYNKTGRWKGIEASNTNINSLIELNNVTMKYTCAEKFDETNFINELFFSEKFIGAITIRYTHNVKIENSIIENHIQDTANIVNYSFVPSAISICASNNNVIKNCKIQYCTKSRGISIRQSDGTIVSNNEIAYNDASIGAGINTGNNQNTLITYNWIHHNYSYFEYAGTTTGGGGLNLVTEKNLRLLNNLIEYNTAYVSGGGLSLTSGSGNTISGNVITNNSTVKANCGYSDGGGGICIRYATNLLIQNNIIANNYSAFTGGGVKLYNNYNNEPKENLIFCNNTVVHNYSNKVFGSGGIEAFTTTFKCYNNIITNNFNKSELQNIGISSNEDSTLWRNNLTNNLASIHRPVSNNNPFDSLDFYFGNPLFIEPSSGVGFLFDGKQANWNVSDSSIVINNGYLESENLNLIDTDIAGNDRIINVIDIGAYEYQQEDFTDITEKLNNDYSVNIFPNPVKNNVTIDIKYKPTEKASLVIANMNGKIINRTSIKLNNSSNLIQTNLSFLSPGIYFIQLLDDSKIITQQSVIKAGNH